MNRNKGFSFIAVIVVMVVILFLTVSCMAIVNNTYSMKQVENKSDSIFYIAEENMEKVRADIVVLCKKSAEKAYIAVLDNLDNIPKENYNDIYAVEFANYFKYDYSDEKNKILAKYNTLTLPEQLDITSNKEIQVDTETISVPESMTLKSVSYTANENGYDKTVKTDIVVTPPDFFNKIPATEEMGNYQDYVLVTDDCITFNGTKIQVDGSTYAGGHSDDGLESSNELAGSGYWFDSNSEVKFLGNHYLLSRGNFDVKNGSSVTADNTNMFVKNINLTQKGSTNEKASLNLNGIVNVEQIMNLDLKDSKVQISGDYNGYTEDGEVTSSIVVNEPGIDVDMTGLNNLVLGGLTYVSNKRDNTFGSSIDAKFMQTMYLVPSECLPLYKVKHVSNPVPYAVWEEIKDTKPDLTKYKKIDLTKFCKKDDCFYTIKDGRGEYVYYFLKFENEEKAKEYANTYLHKRDALMLDRADAFQYGNVLVGKGTKITAKGLIVGYDKNKGFILSNTNQSKDVFSENATTRQKALELLSTLQERQGVTELTENIFSTIFSAELYKNRGMLYEDEDCDGKGYIVKIANTDDTITVSGYQTGLIITTGKVRIADNSTFVGNIFAAKGITCGANSIATSASKEQLYPFVYLTQNYTKRKEILKYFNNIQTDDKNDNVSAEVEDNVRYDNWTTE